MDVLQLNMLAKALENTGKEIVIWGAGSYGEQVLELCENLSVTVSFFVDRDYLSKQGKFKIDVCSTERLKNSFEKYFVLIASMYCAQIKETAEAWGYREFESYLNIYEFTFSSRILDYTEKTRCFINGLGEAVPMFRAIQIETVNRCNNDCSFCPANRHIDKREYKLMSDTLFEKVVSELGEMDFNGMISFYSNNEPLLDKRLPKMLESIRKAVPNSWINTYTNGILLTIPLLEQIIENLDLLLIDNYSDNYEFTKPIKDIYDFCRQNKKYAEKVKICKRLKSEVLSTRGGQAPNKQKTGLRGVPCAHPFQQIIILPDGKVSLCCNDPMAKCIVGDINARSMREVWYSAQYNDVRRAVAKGRENVPLCAGCDVLYNLPEKVNGNLTGLQFLNLQFYDGREGCFKTLELE